MATVVDRGANARSGLVMAIAIIGGLIALVAANFSLTRNVTSSNVEISTPTTPPASSP